MTLPTAAAAESDAINSGLPSPSSHRHTRHHKTDKRRSPQPQVLEEEEEEDESCGGRLDDEGHVRNPHGHGRRMMMGSQGMARVTHFRSKISLELCRFRFIKNTDSNSSAILRNFSGIGTGSGIDDSSS